MILVVPAAEKGRGGGHLVRCTKLADELQALGKDAILFDIKNKRQEKKIELIILDRFQTPQEELKHWKQLAPVIGIDEGGASRDEFDFLIDILPNLEKVKPNISDIGLLPLPTKNFLTTEDTEKIKVLISFGMEDSAELGEKVFDALNKVNDNRYEITFANKDNFIPNLSERLHEYDLVFTHFGITAFEAIYAGTQVLLINPTKYHEKLSKKAGFKTIKKISVPREPSVRRLRARKICNFTSKSLSKLITSFSPQINRLCPVCETVPPTKAIARFSDRTYRRCTKCGIIFMDRLTPAPIEYGKEYFFENYKKQYGKTYLEDFPNLKSTAKKRLKIIKSLIPAPCSLLPVLDIGCGYGAFLAAAKEEDFDPCGIDPCKEAIEYVQNELKIQATHGFFPHSPLPTPHSPLYNTITLWFTIEHFQDCISVLAEIRKLLKPNGLLAFSTPSFSGISGRKNRRRFLEKSPADHYTIWSPKTCKKALSLAGFKVKKIVNCGHHPSRFPILGKLACCKYSPFFWILLVISKLFKLGDTFEVYAVNLFEYKKNIC